MIKNKYISAVKETKFFGLMTDNTLSWKGHIDYIIPKLSSACYVMRTVKPYVLYNTLKIIYYSYFHSVLNYGLLFWRSSTESIKIFKLQKNMIRIMMGYKSNHLCRDLFVTLRILPLSSQYISSLLFFLNKNKDQFKVNSEIYHYATRQQSNFHQPSANLTKYRKGVCYLSAKVFNKLPSYIKEEFDNPKKFKLIFKKFLNEKSFHSLQAYFELQN
jgi:hypothetical protein